METAYPTTWIEYKIRKDIVTQHTCAHIILTVIEDLVKMLFQKEPWMISSSFHHSLCKSSRKYLPTQLSVFITLSIPVLKHSQLPVGIVCWVLIIVCASDAIVSHNERSDRVWRFIYDLRLRPRFSTSTSAGLSLYVAFGFCQQSTATAIVSHCDTPWDSASFELYAPCASWLLISGHKAI